MLLANVDLSRMTDAFTRGDAASFARLAATLGVELSLERFTQTIQANSLLTDPTKLAYLVLSCIQQAMVDGQAHERFDKGVGCLAVRVDDRVVLGLAWLGREGLSKVWPEVERWYRDSKRNRKTAIVWASDPRRRDDALTLRVVTRPLDVALDARGINLERDLREAIIADPTDDAARLVYADWLLDHDDPRGELIRVDHELRDAALRDPRRPALLARQRSLLRDHGDAIARDVAGLVDEYGVRAGFVDRIALRVSALAKHGAALLAAHPIRHITLLVDDQTSFMQIVDHASLLAGVRSLELAGNTRKGSARIALEVGRLDAERLFPASSALEQLMLSDLIANTDDWERLLHAIEADRLHTLVYRRCPLEARLLAVLGRTMTIAPLTSLTIDRPQFAPEELRELPDQVTALQRHAFTALHFKSWFFHAPGLASVAAAIGRTHTAHTLEFTDTRIGPLGLSALRDSPRNRSLRSLALAGTDTAPPDIAALLRSDNLVNLEHLAIATTHGDSHAMADAVLGAGPSLTRVDWRGPIARLPELQARFAIVTTGSDGELESRVCDR